MRRLLLLLATMSLLCGGTALVVTGTAAAKKKKAGKCKCKTGPRGATGPAGPAGPQGPQGPAGSGGGGGGGNAPTNFTNALTPNQSVSANIGQWTLRINSDATGGCVAQVINNSAFNGFVGLEGSGAISIGPAQAVTVVTLPGTSGTGRMAVSVGGVLTNGSSGFNAVTTLFATTTGSCLTSGFVSGT